MKKSQCNRILDYLAQHGSVTIRQIQTDLCINGATSRISDLRQKGYNITDEFAKSDSGTAYKVYYRGPDAFNTEVPG